MDGDKEKTKQAKTIFFFSAFVRPLLHSFKSSYENHCSELRKKYRSILFLVGRSTFLNSLLRVNIMSRTLQYDLSLLSINQILKLYAHN